MAILSEYYSVINVVNGRQMQGTLLAKHDKQLTIENLLSVIYSI